jgi:hypothetical protein
MKVIEVSIKERHKALASTGMIRDGRKVEWGYRDEVEFKRKGDRFDLEVIVADGARQRVWLSTGFKEFSKAHRDLAKAAAHLLGLRGFYVNGEFIVLTQNSEVREVRVLSLEEIEEPAPRHLTDLPMAQERALSGYRREPKQRQQDNRINIGISILSRGLSFLAQRG